MTTWFHPLPNHTATRLSAGSRILVQRLLQHMLAIFSRYAQIPGISTHTDSLQEDNGKASIDSFTNDFSGNRSAQTAIAISQLPSPNVHLFDTISGISSYQGPACFVACSRIAKSFGRGVNPIRAEILALFHVFYLAGGENNPIAENLFTNVSRSLLLRGR